MLAPDRLDAIASELRQARDGATQLAPVSGREPGFTLEDGYAVAARLHRRKLEAGGVPRGRKIGFTNANIWPEYDVHHPIWGWVYADTLQHAPGGAPVAVGLGGTAEPKIEPEIAFGLRQAPPAGADVATLAGCIDWVAPAFEVVQSHFPGWKFKAADTVADGGLHARLVVGRQVALEQLGADPVACLAGFELVLQRDGQHVETGRGGNVLGSPLAALAHLVALLDGQDASVRLQAGEVITTGTLTAAYPIRPGERWRAEPRGIALEPLEVHFR